MEPERGPEGGAVGGEVDPAARLAYLRTKIGDCTRCGLSARRIQVVFGNGSASARLMLVGEAPGRDEDQSGVPFVGQAGHLLDRMLRDSDISRERVFVANVVKCRPKDNRDPLPEEIAACAPFLRAQIAVIRPKYLVALGRFSGNALAGTTGLPLKTLQARGLWLYRDGRSGMQVPVTVLPHPSWLLRRLGDPVLREAGRRDYWDAVTRLRAALVEADLLA